ncbi:MAG: phosphate transport system regulatory protein PhoU [Acidobacteria bacterium]|nr:MAG: phosphate transport system regulatory protein PhoU [Acidobacteriota bacterium]
MERRFEQDLESLAERVQHLGGLVERAIGRSIRALVERDEAAARAVIEGDAEIDAVELEIDQLAMQILARYQLAGRDLRFVTTAMKITPDLERIADHAVNVSERALEMLQEPPLKAVVDLKVMARRAQEMVRAALDAFVRRDAEAARAVIQMDDEVDAMTVNLFRSLLSYMLEDPKTITRSIRLTFTGKYFERIADQAVNIAELIVYMVEGRVIKHAQASPPAG